MKYFIALLLFTISYLLGWSFRSHEEKQEQVAAEFRKTLSEKYTDSRGLPLQVAMDRVLGVADATKQKSPSKEDLVSAQKIADNLEFPNKAKLSSLLKKNEAGIKLYRYIATINYGENSERSSPIASDYLAPIWKNPSEGLNIIRDDMKQLSVEEFPLERFSLLATAASLPGQAEASKKLIEDEIVQHSSNDFYALTGYQLLMGKIEDGAEGLRATLNIVSASNDSKIQAALVKQFSHQWPNLQSQLHQGLLEKGIHEEELNAQSEEIELVVERR